MAITYVFEQFMIRIHLDDAWWHGNHCQQQRTETFETNTGASLFLYTWAPSNNGGNPRGILQIVHGARNVCFVRPWRFLCAESMETVQGELNYSLNEQVLRSTQADTVALPVPWRSMDGLFWLMTTAVTGRRPGRLRTWDIVVTRIPGILCLMTSMRSADWLAIDGQASSSCALDTQWEVR